MSLYMAPEVVTGDYGVKVDYFSFGCILYEIFEGRESFLELSKRSLTSNTCEFTNLTQIEMQKFIRSCLSVDKDNRCEFLNEQSNPSLFLMLSDIVRSDIDLNESEREIVEEYIHEIECSMGLCDADSVHEQCDEDSITGDE